MRRHEERCLEQSYRPRGRIRRERESRGRSQSPRGDGGSRRPKSRSPKPERYDKFASSRNQSTRPRSHPRRHESPQSHSNIETRKIPQTTTSEDNNDLPASPQLSIDFSNNPFCNDNVVNLFTKLDLETSTATNNLEGIMNTCNFISEEPQQTLPFNIFQSSPAVPLSTDLTYQLDQNHNLIYLTSSTPFQTETHFDSMTDTDDWLPPPPPEESVLPLPPAPVTQFLELPDFDEPLPPPPTDEQTTDSLSTATNRTEDMTTTAMTTTTDEQTTDSLSTATNRTEDVTTTAMTTPDSTTTDEQTTYSLSTATNWTEDMTTTAMTTTSDSTTTDEQTTDSLTTATNRTEDMTTTAMTTTSDCTTTDEQTTDSLSIATNRTEDVTTTAMSTTTDEQTTDSLSTATNRTEDVTTTAMTTTSDCTTSTRAAHTPHRRISIQTYRQRAAQTTTRTRTTNSPNTSITTSVTDNLTQTTDKSSRTNSRQTGDDLTLKDRYPNFTLDQIKTAFRQIPDGLDQGDSDTDSSISSYTCSKGSSCSDCSTSTDHDRHASQGRNHMDEEITPPPAKKPRLEYDPLLTTTRQSKPLYSRTMPAFSPEHTCTYRPTKIFKSQDGATFPPRPITIPTNPGKDRYAYLAHDPRTVFAGAPSSFLKSLDARYASRLRKRALQIGVKQDDISYCIDGHTLTKREIVHDNDFHYELTTTFTPIPTAKKFKDRSSQMDRPQRRCTEDCPGCGNTFTFTCT